MSDDKRVIPQYAAYGQTQISPRGGDKIMGFEVQKPIPPEEVARLLAQLYDVADVAPWVGGDIFWQADSEDIPGHLAILDVAEQTVNNWKVVCKAIDIANRRPGLSFSIHAEIPPLCGRLVRLPSNDLIPLDTFMLDWAETLDNPTVARVRTYKKKYQAALPAGKFEGKPFYDWIDPNRSERGDEFRAADTITAHGRQLEQLPGRLLEQFENAMTALDIELRETGQDIGSMRLEISLKITAFSNGNGADYHDD